MAGKCLAQGVGKALFRDETDRLEFRQAKIEQLRARFRQHDVPGLQVTMDDAGPMRGGKGTGNLNPEFHRLSNRHGGSREPLFECLPFEILHHEEVDPVVAPNVKHWTDVWMTQGGKCFGLPLEPSLQLGITCNVFGQNLEGHRAVQASVCGLVDFAHTAGTDRRGNRIRAKAVARSEHHATNSNRHSATLVGSAGASRPGSATQSTGAPCASRLGGRVSGTSPRALRVPVGNKCAVKQYVRAAGKYAASGWPPETGAHLPVSVERDYDTPTSVAGLRPRLRRSRSVRGCVGVTHHYGER